MLANVAVDAADDVLYLKRGADAFSGVSKYGPLGDLLYRVPYGEVATMDAAGNAYVAGSFTAPQDFGLGLLVPNGNVDVFVVKLDPTGRPLFARQLDLCGDGVTSIAVDVNGRIAVSGAALGTVVLDANGGRLFQLGFSGDVAFDTQGNLIVGGSFNTTVDLGGGHILRNSGDGDGFLAKVDANGNLLFAYDIGDADLPATIHGSGRLESRLTSQRVRAVAVDAQDEIALIGEFDYDIKLFGQNQSALEIAISDVADFLHHGSFVAKLDAAGNLLWEQFGSDASAMNDVAIDLAGNVYGTGDEYGNASPPFRYRFVQKFDPAATTFGGATTSDGSGHALAVDGCGRMIWASSFRLGGPLVRFDAKLDKFNL
ncbi:MAG: hypothetical protein JWO36_2480 [Myxococcales bacterium]|nr:hypothetical protein [Myxococcales bacterium]